MVTKESLCLRPDYSLKCVGVGVSFKTGWEYVVMCMGADNVTVYWTLVCGHSPMLPAAQPPWALLTNSLLSLHPPGLSPARLAFSAQHNNNHHNS